MSGVLAAISVMNRDHTAGAVAMQNWLTAYDVPDASERTTGCTRAWGNGIAELSARSAASSQYISSSVSRRQAVSGVSRRPVTG